MANSYKIQNCTSHGAEDASHGCALFKASYTNASFKEPLLAT
jgi:hypothetical protein